MGMYDHVVCKYPLPDGYVPSERDDFQTKQFDCELAEYEIGADGKLRRIRAGWLPDGIAAPVLPVEIPYHGDLNFYETFRRSTARVGGKEYAVTSDGSRVIWREYHARFNNGTLVEITGGPEYAEDHVQIIDEQRYRALEPQETAEREATWAKHTTDKHHKAMALADQALLLKLADKHDEAKLKNHEAADTEYGAAVGCRDEPTMTVLYRSAAWLYLDAGRLDEALKVVACWCQWKRHPGLDSAPAELREEVAKVLDAIAKQIRS
jgi:hypothetical protein